MSIFSFASPYSEIVEDISGNADGIATTGTQLNSLTGISNALNIEYANALARASYADRNAPTVAEIQQVINNVTASILIPIYGILLGDEEKELDSDGDGVVDKDDAFPNDANETVDTDGDDTGNNADLDDDNDGFSDIHEIISGTDPLDVSDFPDTVLLEESTKYPKPEPQGICTNRATTTERVTAVEENKLALTNALHDHNTTTMTYCPDHVAEYGSAFELNYVYEGGTGMDGYPNGLVGGYQKGKWHPGDVRLSGMPALLSDLTNDMVIQWKVSQENALDDGDDDSDKWMASINIIFDDGEIDARPDDTRRFYDVVIELNSHNFSNDLNDTNLTLDPDVIKRSYFARNDDGSLRTFDLMVDGQIYKYGVRYKFYKEGISEAKDKKVHVKYIPISEANVPPYLNHSMKAFIDNSKEFIQYARMPESYRTLANATVAKPTLYIKSVRGGYEVYKGQSTLRNDYFRIMKPVIPPTAPTITGIAKTAVNVYGAYQFLPTAFDANYYDVLTFSIENKPSWAEFNATTGLLEGIAVEGGSSANIIISVSDGTNSVSLAPFDIAVNPAIDIAHPFGKAIQGKRRSGHKAFLAIDGDTTTYSYTEDDDWANWWQVELPKDTLVSKVMIQGLYHTDRLAGAKVYLTNTAHDTNVATDENRLIMTLLGDGTEQIKVFNSVKKRTYLLIKAPTNMTLGLGTVEVYGSLPVAPTFDNEAYTVTIDKWQNKTQGFFNVNAVDYQEDALVYSIESDVPFRIDAEGNLIVDDLLLVQDYTFDVRVSDGINSLTQEMVVKVRGTTQNKEPIKSSSTSPAVTGYLPNTYEEGDVVSITIQGRSYEATVYADGTWSIEADTISPALATGSYNVTLVVDGEEILYPNYIVLYVPMLKKSEFNLAMDSMADMDVNITAHVETPLATGEKVRGTSISLKVEAGVTTLENKSYREIKSLLGRYLDENNNSVFVKLNFNQNILPYSSNTLTSFANDANISIVKTANMFDMEFYFDGEDCSDVVDDSRDYYCLPTDVEKGNYSVYLSLYNHFYNSVNGLAVMKAWVANESYKTLDSYTYAASNYYWDEAYKLDYYYKNLYYSIIPNMV